jgi:hypothetical protein
MLPPMKSWQKCLAGAGLILASLGLTGCGGINANGSVSPIMFIQHQAPPTGTNPSVAPSVARPALVTAPGAVTGEATQTLVPVQMAAR